MLRAHVKSKLLYNKHAQCRAVITLGSDQGTIASDSEHIILRSSCYARSSTRQNFRRRALGPNPAVFNAHHNGPHRAPNSCDVLSVTSMPSPANVFDGLPINPYVTLVAE